MALLRRLAVLVSAAEAGRRYARNNPQQVGRMAESAARFVDRQTKGRYRSQLDGVVRKVQEVAGQRPETRPSRSP